MSAHRGQCLGMDSGKKAIMRDDCDWKDHSYTWMWENDDHIRMVGTDVSVLHRFLAIVCYGWIAFG